MKSTLVFAPSIKREKNCCEVSWLMGGNCQCLTHIFPISVYTIICTKASKMRTNVRGAPRTKQMAASKAREFVFRPVSPSSDRLFVWIIRFLLDTTASFLSCHSYTYLHWPTALTTRATRIGPRDMGTCLDSMHCNQEMLKPCTKSIWVYVNTRLGSNRCLMWSTLYMDAYQYKQGSLSVCHLLWGKPTQGIMSEKYLGLASIIRKPFE